MVVLQFARDQQGRDQPLWYVSGSKAFRSRAESHTLRGAYEAVKGYYVGLKSCLAGLVLVCDLSVTCFLASGEMIEVMRKAGTQRSSNVALSSVQT